MFADKHIPNSITGEELDAYLDKGWYRMGQTIFTCHFLFFEEKLFSPIWTRLPLQGYKFRKSVRKIMAKCEEDFDIFVRPGKIDEEKEALFQKYRRSFKGVLSPSLNYALMDNLDFNIYASYEVAIYDKGTLIAFSFFDLGKDSLSSIKGVYDPDYSKYSLGLYTMLREIQFGLEQDYKYFYPGYVVPGFNRFDYKLRMGKPEEIEYYDLKTAKWWPWTQFIEDKIPSRFLTHKLSEIGRRINNYGVACHIVYYPDFPLRMNGTERETLQSPLFLVCHTDLLQVPRFLVYYDFWKETFVLCHSMPTDELAFYFSNLVKYEKGEAQKFFDFLLSKSTIIETTDLEEVVRWVVAIGKVLKDGGQRLK